MYNLEGKTLAISPLVIRDVLQGIAFSSKDKSIFIECSDSSDFKINRNKFIQKTIDQAKLIIGYSLLSEFEFTKFRSIKPLFYNMNPEIRLKNLKDIMKVSEDYSRPDKFLVIGENYKKSLEYQKQVSNCVKESQFIYGYYFNNRELYKNDLVKLDNKLLKLLSQKSVIEIDKVESKTLSIMYLSKQWELEHKLWGIIGYPFNYLNELDKNISSNRDVVDLYNDVNELKNRYQGISDYIDCDSVKIQLDPLGSSTGRIVCRDQFGVFTPANYHRNIFKSKKDYTFLEFDYKHQEATIIANITKDPKLITLLENDTLYTNIAKLAKIKCENTRDIGKNLFFSIVYGAQVNSLESRFNIDKTQLDKVYNYIQENFPKTYKYMGLKFKTNIFGRELHSNNFNSLIQSTAADIVKHKLVELDIIPSIVFSDALVFEIPDEDIVTKVKRIKSKLTSPINSIGDTSPLIVKISKNKTLKF